VAVVALASAGSASAASDLYIRGGGYGHGIGMSQYGAYGFALHGKDYRWILAHYYQGTALGKTNPNRVIRVLLSTGSAAFSGADHAPGKKLDPSQTYWVRANADGTLKLVNQKGKKVGTFAAPLSVSGPGPLNVAGLGAYRGSLQFRPDGAGGVMTVDALDLEDYVRGVISWEMPSSWAPAALEVQAVAARTYALSTNAGGTAFDVYRDTRSQMYGGVAAETASTDAAVAATPGQIVTYKGAPIVTYFSSSSGGHTENIEDVWVGATPEPWLRGVSDPYDGVANNPYHRWGSQMTVAAAAARLGKLVKGRLIGIQITKHGSSPRILLADVVGTKGRTTVTGAQVQQIFGLLTTYAAFTTITSLPGRPPAPVTHSRRHAARSLPQGVAGAQAVVALVPLVNDLVAGAVPAMYGTVFPAHKGDALAVEAAGAHGWTTVMQTHVSDGGAYAVQLPGPGTYRVVYRGIAGPSVNVG
jgi:stage II sporulation protein D